MFRRANLSHELLKVANESAQRLVCQSKLARLRDDLELVVRFHAIELVQQLLEADQTSLQVDLHFLFGADEPIGVACRATPKFTPNLQAARATRRHFAGLLTSIAFLPWASRIAAADGSGPGREFGSSSVQTYPLFDEATASVIPKDGFQSRIALNDSIVKLVEHGVIDREKFLALYAKGEPLPEEFVTILGKPSDRKILLTTRNAPYYVNLLWPVGLTTQMRANAGSPLNGDSLFGFASTGGGTLGRKANGGAYFNKFPIVRPTKR